MTVRICIGLYLAAAIAANVVVSAFGPWALPFTAFAIVPFDLVTRDVLHEHWHGRGLWLRMLGLVVTGSALSFVTASPAVCIASAVAFAAAGLTNAGLYQLASRQSRLARMNLSNCGAALTDSILFPLIAFAVLSPALVVSQAAMKIAGGAIWSAIILKAAR